MAKTLDDLYDKLNEIAKSLNSIEGDSSSNSEEGGNDKSKKNKEKPYRVTFTEEAFKGLKKSVKFVWESWKSLDDQIYKTGRAIGYNSKGLDSFFESTTKNIQEVAHAVGVTDKAIMQLQTSLVDATSKAMALTREQTALLAGMSKFAKPQDIQEMVSHMDKFGASIGTSMLRLAKAQNQAKKWGLSSEKNAELVAKNIKLASSYSFKGGTSELARMVTESQRLKYNLESVMGSAEKFYTIDEGIQTSAKLQVLGGGFAREFTNPLHAMYAATSDASEYTEIIERAVEGMGYFNSKTGEVEMSPINKMKLREASKTLGIGYDEMYNMASSQIKNKEIEKVVRGKGFSEDQLKWLTTQANFEDGVWKVNVFNPETSKMEEREIVNLTSKQIEFMQDQAIGEDGMFKDVRSIKTYVAKLAGETRSYNEMYEGAESSMKAWSADMIDGWIGSGMRGFVDSMGMWTIPLFAGLGTAGGLGYGKIQKSIMNRVAESGVKKAPTHQSNERSLGKTLEEPNFEKPKKSKIKIKGKGLLGGIIGTVIGAGMMMYLSNPSNNNRQQISSIPRNSDIADSNNPILNELRVQTSLLERMAYPSFYGGRNIGISADSQIEAPSFLRELGGMGKGMIQDPQMLLYMIASLKGSSKAQSIIKRGGQYVDDLVNTKQGQYVVEKGGKLLNTKIGRAVSTPTKAVGNLGKKLVNKIRIPKGMGPAMLAQMGLDFTHGILVGNDVIEEGGAWDKGLSIGSGALSGALTGLMVGGPIGAVIGGVVGVVQGAAEAFEQDLRDANHENWAKVAHAIAHPLDGMKQTSEDIHKTFGEWKSEGGWTAVGAYVVDGLYTLTEWINPVHWLGQWFGETEEDRRKEELKAVHAQILQAQEDWETTKLSSQMQAINDPMLQVTVKIHDLLITWYHAFRGVNSDATGELEDIKIKDIEQVAGGSNGGIVGGTSHKGDKVLARVNSGEMVLNANQQAKLYHIANDGIKAKDIVGQPQYISPSAPSPSVNVGNQSQTNTINLNVNGTLKLESNDKNLSIDMNKLLENPQFQQEIIKIVQEGLNTRSQGSARINKESVYAKTGGAITQHQQYGV